MEIEESCTNCKHTISSDYSEICDGCRKTTKGQDNFEPNEIIVELQDTIKYLLLIIGTHRVETKYYNGLNPLRRATDKELWKVLDI